MAVMTEFASSKPIIPALIAYIIINIIDFCYIAGFVIMFMGVSTARCLITSYNNIGMSTTGSSDRNLAKILMQEKA